MPAETVIREYSDMVYRIAFARTGNKADADDIYQEVFLRYIRRKPEFRSEEHAKAWFIKVAINCARKFMSKNQKNAETVGDWTEIMLQKEDEKTTFQCARSLKGCETAEDFALTVYFQLEQMFSSVKGNKKMCEWVVEELAKVKQEIGSGTQLQDGCAAGVQLMIDDINSYCGGNDTVVKVYVCDRDDEDGDGDRTEWVGISLLKIDFEEWKKVTEETGKTEFEAEAIAGVPGTYHITIQSYEPALAFHYELVY